MALSNQFYVITQPGLEAELRQEISEIWPYLLNLEARPNAEPVIFLKQEIGGWLIEAPLILGLQLNHFSHLASRILLRLDEFKVKDFPKLYDRLRKIPVDSYFSKQDFRVEVAASKSRLNNEKRILELAKKAWPKMQEEASGAIMIRMHDDICTVSVDTTGEHLHRREHRASDKWIGEAPIRETLAAFCIRKLIAAEPLASLSEVILCDPMAGSGTLLKEAHQLLQGHFLREYSFQKFAVTPKLLKLEGLASNFTSFPTLFAKLWATDRDQKMMEVLRRNLSEISAKQINCADVFSNSDPVGVSVTQRLWLVTNPPYGERLEFKEGFERLGEAMAQRSSERIGVILPKGAFAQFFKGLNRQSSWQVQSQSFFKNGGISVEFSVFVPA